MVSAIILVNVGVDVVFVVEDVVGAGVVVAVVADDDGEPPNENESVDGVVTADGSADVSFAFCFARISRRFFSNNAALPSFLFPISVVFGLIMVGTAPEEGVIVVVKVSFGVMTAVGVKLKLRAGLLFI